MRDEEARKRIEYLTKTVEDMRGEVNRLWSRTWIDTAEEMKQVSVSIYPDAHGIHAEQIDKVVQLILTHLGLELHYVPLVDSKHVLRRKSQAKKGIDK